VALAADDTLVVLDGGGRETARLDEIATVTAGQGATVHHIRRADLGEPLSIFPLTVVVQKIALELAEARGTNPDSFGKDLPGRADAWSAIKL
jgi:glucosamine--fructose-6-phosphate aminotransferase (isomerizing)